MIFLWGEGGESVQVLLGLDKIVELEGAEGHIVEHFALVHGAEADITQVCFLALSILLVVFKLPLLLLRVLILVLLRLFDWIVRTGLYVHFVYVQTVFFEVSIAILLVKFFEIAQRLVII